MELNPRISGGFRLSKDIDWDSISLEIKNSDVDINYLDDDISVNVVVNPVFSPFDDPVFFPEDLSIEDLVFSPVLGDPIVETPSSSIVDNPSVSQPLCL